MRTILNFLRLLPVFALAFLLVNCGCIDSFNGAFHCDSGAFIGRVARGLGLLARA
jgi:hypothetical protein